MNSCKGSVTRFYQCVTHCSKLQPQTQHTVSSSLRFNTTPTCAISKAPVHFSPSLGFVPALSLETVPTVVCLTTALSRPFQQDCRHLPLSAHLSFFQARLSTASSFCPSLVFSSKIVDSFLFLPISRFSSKIVDSFLFLPISRFFKQDCRQLPLSAHLSFRRIVQSKRVTGKKILNGFHRICVVGQYD